MTQVEVLKSAVREILNKKFNNLKEVGWTFTGFNIARWENRRGDLLGFYFLFNFIISNNKGYLMNKRDFWIKIEDNEFWFDEDINCVNNADMFKSTDSREIMLSNGDVVLVSGKIGI